jgi:hypothetical protein
MRPIAHACRQSSPAAASRHAVDAVVVGNPAPTQPKSCNDSSTEKILVILPATACRPPLRSRTRQSSTEIEAD